MDYALLKASKNKSYFSYGNQYFFILKHDNVAEKFLEIFKTPLIRISNEKRSVLKNNVLCFINDLVCNLLYLSSDIDSIPS